MGIGPRLSLRVRSRAAPRATRWASAERSPRRKPTGLPPEARRQDQRRPAPFDDDLPGLADLFAAFRLVETRAASCVTLCGFAEGYAGLRAARALALDGILAEVVIRPSGGGFDIRVRRVTPPEA